MYCPKCGSIQSEELKFCKLCGANLFAVRQVVDSRETDDSFDWSKTWVAEMFRSSDEIKRRKLEMERQAGITPEMKRVTEIKAGIITSSVGIGLGVLLFVLMQGLILGGNISQSAAELLSRLWIVGIIPLFVGLALIINGLVVSKRLVKLSQRPTQNNLGEGAGEPRSLNPSDTNEFLPSRFSVTEGTTQHLNNQSEYAKEK